MSKHLDLLHLINGRSANVGNGALTLGLERLLNEDLPFNITWSRECWDDYTFGVRKFDSKFVDLINESDGMIVGGAVALNGRSFYPEAGMRFNLSPDLLQAINKPLVFYGFSYRVWPGQKYEHLDKLFNTLNVIREKDNMLLAVRNDGTKDWLHREFSIDTSFIYTVPDPGVFVPVKSAQTAPHQLIPDRPNVIIAPNDEDREQRYLPHQRTSIISSLASFIETIVAKHNANVILVPHYYDDLLMISQLVDAIKPSIAHQNITCAGLSRISGTNEFYDLYTKVDAIFSMRVHSMSPCIGLQLPMVPVVTQARMTDFLDTNSLRDLQINAFDPELSTLLYSSFLRLLSKPSDFTEKYYRSTQSMRAQARHFNQLVASLLS